MALGLRDVTAHGGLVPEIEAMGRRALPLQMEIENPGEQLLVGQVGTAVLFTRERTRMPAVPSAAVLMEAGRPYVFVQIGGENVHLVRCVMDEIFGSENCISQVVFRKTAGATSEFLPPTADHLLWYSKDRGRAFGVFGAIAGSGAALGLLLGGLLTEYLSWRWCLFVNLAFAIPAAAAALALLEPGAAAAKARVDVPGTLTATLGLLALVYGFNHAETHGWGATATVVALIAITTGVTFLGRKLDAGDMQRLGLVNLVVPQAELDPTVAGWAQEVARPGGASSVSGVVSRARTISTSFIRGTGLKKCIPASRPGRSSTAAISVRLSAPASRSCARPKSITLITCCFVAIRFDGLMSRWTIPTRCAASRPRAACKMHPNA